MRAKYPSDTSPEQFEPLRALLEISCVKRQFAVDAMGMPHGVAVTRPK